LPTDIKYLTERGGGMREREKREKRSVSKFDIILKAGIE
jgi:hypothetical protein